MSQELQELVARVQDAQMTTHEQVEQRRSFVYGNTHIENDRITKEMVQRVDEKLEAKKKEG
jgi:hypothetical protein